MTPEELAEIKVRVIGNGADPGLSALFDRIAAGAAIPENCVKVRIAVCVCACGQWLSFGSSEDKGDDVKASGAKDFYWNCACPDPVTSPKDRVSFVEALVPRPVDQPVTTVQGTVAE